MGALGEYPRKEMLGDWIEEAARWQKADPSKPVKKALHLVAISAQGTPQKDGNYRLADERQNDSQSNQLGSSARCASFFGYPGRSGGLKGESWRFLKNT
jgi:hypothetical protein